MLSGVLHSYTALDKTCTSSFSKMCLKVYKNDHMVPLS